MVLHTEIEMKENNSNENPECSHNALMTHKTTKIIFVGINIGILHVPVPYQC